MMQRNVERIQELGVSELVHVQIISDHSVRSCSFNDETDTPHILYDIRWNYKHDRFHTRDILSVRDMCFYTLNGLSLQRYKDRNTIQSVHSIAKNHQSNTIIKYAREDPNEAYYGGL